MTGVKGPALGGPGVCKHCTGVGDAHKLTCRTLQMEKGWYERMEWWEEVADDFEREWLKEQSRW